METVTAGGEREKKRRKKKKKSKGIIRQIRGRDPWVEVTAADK